MVKLLIIIQKKMNQKTLKKILTYGFLFTTACSAFNCATEKQIKETRKEYSFKGKPQITIPVTINDSVIAYFFKVNSTEFVMKTSENMSGDSIYSILNNEEIKFKAYEPKNARTTIYEVNNKKIKIKK
jgi:hypothetical protein